MSMITTGEQRVHGISIRGLRAYMRLNKLNYKLK
jgi:hypothetical protein